MSDASLPHEQYDFLIKLLLKAEGNTAFEFQDYHLSNHETITIPHSLVPIIFSGSMAMQMATSFMSLYKPHEDQDVLFDQATIKSLLSLINNDVLRTQPVFEVSKIFEEYNQKQQKIFLYDDTLCYVKPYSGLSISHLETYLSHYDIDDDSVFYLIGDISDWGVTVLNALVPNIVINGISPSVYDIENYNKRLSFFSDTILAGLLNVQLPALEVYLLAGVSPITVYHLLYRFESQKVIQNILCLMNAKIPSDNHIKKLNYSRLTPHTDIQNHAKLKKNAETANYLNLLCSVG